MIHDPYFKVNVVRSTERPQILSWEAAHRDYSEEISSFDNPLNPPKTEKEAGVRLTRLILPPGHYGVLEHAHITFECVGFPHSVPMQARTHRVPYSFDIQSQRYTGKRILDLVENLNTGKYWDEITGKPEEKYYEKLRQLFYVRPESTYTDRQGTKFEITENTRDHIYLNMLLPTAANYYYLVKQLGFSEESARGVLGQDIRQGFFMTTNIRGLMHFLDMRSKKDAQIEIQWLCELLFEKFKKWCPEIASWYEEKRLGKNKLAP